MVMDEFGHSYDWQLEILIIFFPYFCGSQKNMNLFIENTLRITKLKKKCKLIYHCVAVSISNAFTFHLETSVLWTLSQIYGAPKTNETPKDKKENNWYEQVLT